MRLRNWLLTGTSIGLMAMTPLTIRAQDGDLVAAYQLYTAAQASGDADALAAAESPFTEACIVAGYTSIEECIAAVKVSAVATQPAPAVEPTPAEEAALVAGPAPEAMAEPTPEPVAETAPEPAAEAAPVEAPVEAAPIDINADLQTQLDVYNFAIADMMAGGDQAAAQIQMASAQQNMADLCAQINMDNLTACLANYGLELPVIPDMEMPAVPEAAGKPVAPVEQPVEPIQDLPAGITQEQVAPVLESAKDPEQPVDDTPAAALAPEVAAEPAPTSDADSQMHFQAMKAVAPVAQEQGVVVNAAAIEPLTVPQNVTIINQTNVTNNNTTNIDNTRAAIDTQQKNVVTEQSIEIATGQATGTTAAQPLDPGQAITQVILQIGTQLIVNSVGQDTDRFYNAQKDEIFYENLSNGRVRETITRPHGTQIVTVRNRNGDVLRRSRIDHNGREYVLAYFDNRYDSDLIEWRDPGQDLPPLRLNIPVRDYVLDAAFADETQVQIFFAQPPVEQVARLYSIDEVKRSTRIRDSVRKLEVGGLTFDSGAATISRDQVGALSNVANAMLQLLANNPSETFLIEGHTDAVGSEISNLQLSELRAATVARILTDFYDVPPENLATQGYGERYLKIRTDLAEHANRRVTIRRITPLITFANR
ncbi:MAG: OmpA family protein [Candidatus Devosia symbiotica]|nr:OmpA family protein [Candidatus Devosia symbiotica]